MIWLVRGVLSAFVERHWTRLLRTSVVSEVGGDETEGDHQGSLLQFLVGCFNARYRRARVVQRVEGERGPQLTDDVRVRITLVFSLRAACSAFLVGCHKADTPS
jgi:hypothetical protein